jgi:hypothetical protein
MKRFLMLVAVATVAGAMYVAASPASQQSRGPTAKQFSALKKQVASLSKTVKALTALGGIEVTLIKDCDQIAQPVDQFGDNVNQTEGYHYALPTGQNPQEILTTALDAAVPTDPTAIFFTGGDASCGTLVNGSALRHAAAKAGLQLRHGSVHPFAAHQR